MPSRRRRNQARPPCRWLRLREALETFVVASEGTQGAAHIHPLHWYVACRLVLEGGFLPDEIKPRPPFNVRREDGAYVLEHDARCGGLGERTVFGGLKTKTVDVVVTKEGIGPVIAVSMKGTLKAFRNLTNRMEEAVGDCTNLHISYPALVYGFLHVLRGTRAGPGVRPNDVAIGSDGQASVFLGRYHEVMARLAGRSDVRDTATRYEAVGLVMVNPDAPSVGELFTTFPVLDSPLHFSSFFSTLYREYDQRFVYGAPALKQTTRRLVWSPESPAVRDAMASEYEPRIGGGEPESDEEKDEDQATDDSEA